MFAKGYSQLYEAASKSLVCSWLVLGYVVQAMKTLLWIIQNSRWCSPQIPGTVEKCLSLPSAHSLGVDKAIDRYCWLALRSSHSCSGHRALVLFSFLLLFCMCCTCMVPVRPLLFTEETSSLVDFPFLPYIEPRWSRCSLCSAHSLADFFTLGILHSLCCSPSFTCGALSQKTIVVLFSHSC